jgi:hypothetical protein
MKIIADLRVDNFGRPHNVPVHDSKVVDFSCSAQERSLRLHAGRPSSDGFVIYCTELIELNVRDLWEENILSDLFLWKVEDVPEFLPAVMDCPWGALLAGRVKVEMMGAESNRISTKYPGSILVVLSSSYGVTLAALCRGVEISVGPA